MASITKLPDGRWRARWRAPAGGSRCKTFELKGEAQTFLVEIEHKKNINGYVDPRAGRVRFATFAASWLNAQPFNPSTTEAVASRLRVHIYPFLGPLELRDFRPSTVQAWIRGRQDVCAPSYVRLLLAHVNSILGAAVDDGLIAKNPCATRAVRAPTVTQEKVIPWSQESVAAVIGTLPTRYRAIAVVASGAGLRQGGVFGLRVEDVDFLGRRLNVRQQIKLISGKPTPAPPKRGKTREVPLAEVVAVALSEHLREHGPGEGGLFFTSREHKPIARTYFNQHIWKPALVKAGIEPTRANGMHALRHYFASVLLDAGESIRALSDYLGHSDPGFTLRVYTHLMPASEDRARRAIDAAFSSSRVRTVSDGAK